MSNIGHNNPPLDPKETIQNNINRKKPILDRDPQFFLYIERDLLPK